MAVFTGSSGNDAFTAAAGNNTYNALGGVDTITFSFNLTDATISYSGNQVIVDAAGFHTVLTGFQKYQFADGLVDENDGDPLVADLFYYSKNHDVWLAHVDAEAHYSAFGFKEGRDPNAFFDTTFYQALNQPVKLAGTNPLTHFDSTGWLAGTPPSGAFDVQAYLAAYPDVAAAHVDPLAHFLQMGGDEGRVPTAISANGVSKLAGANGFDPVFYLLNNPDVAAAGVDPLTHFQVFGWKEGRNPNAFFDTEGYLETYADVKAAGVNPLDHYNAFGWKEGRDPSPWFDTSEYLADNPDVAAAGVNPLVHYLLFGVKEGRVATPLSLEDANGAANQIAVAAANGTNAGATMSWGGWKAVTYSLVADESAGGFAIDPVTGVITVADTSKVSANNTFTLTIRAAEDGHELLKDIDIIVGTGIANSAPTIGLANALLSTPENGADIKVADIVITDDGQGTNSLTLSGADAGSFSIVNGIGGPELHFLGGANFEVKSSYEVFVNVDDPTLGLAPDASAQLNLNIINVDEVDPTFTSGTTASAIDENSGAGQVVYTAVAVDTDFNGPMVVIYSLGSAGGDEAAFSIDAMTGAVTLTGNPNFEAKSSYSFEVVATDATGNSTAQTVTLTINNKDEAAPGFTSGTTAAAIDENSGAGQVVYTAAATDPAADGGPSNPVTFSLGSAGGDEGAFSINPATGAVTLTGNPSFEAKSSYVFEVVATDAAGNSTSQTVSLAINNLDEVGPGFTSGATAAAIDENSGAGQLVYTAAATDPAADGGPSNPVTFSLGSAGGDEGAFSIDSGTGAVTLTGDPNFEAKSSYSFEVVATDAAGNATSQTVSLAINNEDEVAPSFTSGTTAAAKDENSGPGQVVYTAVAVDTDFNAPATATSITYSLGSAGGDEGAFSIDSGTGAVTLTGDPNFETKSSYSFEVVATDAAGNSTSQTVSLAINNKDEVAPGFTSGTTAAAIDENSGAGQVVYTAAATDPAADGGPSNPVTFSLGNAGGDEGAFSINPATGAVTLTGNPSFEAKPSYSFEVVATDAAGNSTSQTVSLAINNKDEVAPGFTSGTTAAAIDENSGAGQVVYTAAATDPAGDGTHPSDGPSNPVTYSLGSAGGDEGAFSIDSGTGAVTLTGDPDFEAKSSYSFEVVATDAAGNTSAQTVNLAINNINEPPVAGDDSASGNEDAAITTGNVLANDSDVDSTLTPASITGFTQGANGSVSSNGDGSFTYTPNLNFSGTDSFTYTVNDGSGGIDTATVNITVNPVSDAPTITADPVTGTASDASIAITLDVQLADPSETITSIIISNVPSSYLINNGAEIADGVWSVPLAGLAGLALIPADGVSGAYGQFDMTVTATSQDGAAAPASAIATISADIDAPAGVGGFALDGYVAGATVFADADGDGVLDAGEISTITAADGSFLLIGANPADKLVMFGGTDISTGLAFVGTMTAPGGSTVITPLTTLVAELVSSGQTLIDAQNNVIAALGLPAVDLSTFDAVAATATNDPAGATVLAAAIQVQTTVAQLAAVTGDTGSVTTALASTLAAGAPVSLTDTAVIENVAATAGVTDTATLDAVKQVVSEANQTIQTAVTTGTNATEVLTGLSQAATVSLGATTQQLAVTNFSDSGSVQQLTDNFTGGALTSQVAAAPVGVISLPIIGTIGNDTLTGTADADAIDGLDGIDSLSGLGGNDVLRGGGGKDLLNGGTGDDTLDGGDGADRATYQDATAGITVMLAAGTVTGDASVGSDTLRAMEMVRGSQHADTFDATGFTALSLNGGGMGIFVSGGLGPQGNFNEFEGLDGDDQITGNGATRISYEHADDAVNVNLTTGIAQSSAPGDAANIGTDQLLGGIVQVRGSAHADALTGSANGNLTSETFEGMGGNDFIDGVSGFDRARYDNQALSGLGIQVDLAAGVVSGRDAAATAVIGTDQIRSIESVRGSNAADIFNAAGFAATATLAAPNAGTDQGNFNEFEGMAGNDQVIGNGNTRVAFTNATAGVTVNIALGTATGDGSVGSDTFSGVNAVRGSSYNDTLTGSDNGNNTTESFDGWAGDDLINGAGGFDRARYDVNAAGNAGIALTLGIAVDMAAGTVIGRDAYATAVLGSDTLRRIESVRGTAADDTYTAVGFTTAAAAAPSLNTGDSGNNGPNGTQAFNEFEGMGGNDQITGNNNTRISYSASSALTGVTVTLVNGAGTATGDAAFIGNDTIVSGVNAVRGTNADDTISATNSGSPPFMGYVLEGLGGVDNITAGSGNDRITGGAGDDTINGGGGNDVAVFSGSLAQYNIVAGGSPGQSTVTDTIANRDGTDSLTATELTEFSDTIKMNQRVLNVSTTGLTGGKSITGTNLDNGSGVGDDLTVGANAGGRTINLLGGGSDKLTLTSAIFVTVANVETLIGSSGNDTVNLQGNVTGMSVDLGGGTSDQLNLANGSNSLTLQGVETVFAGGSNNTLTLDNTVTNIAINLGGGTNTLNLAAGTNGLVNVFGVATINGSASADTLSLANGLFNTTVDLGGGFDDLNIGSQFATFGIANVDVVHGNIQDNGFTFTTNVSGVTVDLGDGNDFLSLANGANSLQAVNLEQINGSDFQVGQSSDDTLTLLNNVTGLTVNLGNGSNTLNLAFGANSFVGVFGTVAINGSIADDTLTITGANGLFNAQVNLGDGTDVLVTNAAFASFGVSGVETINGNASDNSVSLTTTVSGITLDLGGGNDSLNIASGTNSFNALGIEQIGSADLMIGAPSSDDTLTLLNNVSSLAVNLGSGTNTLSLAAGANTLTNVFGVATINGSGSDDTLTLTNNLFMTTVDLGGGNDTLDLADFFNTVTVKDVETVLGGSLSDQITIANTAGTTTVTGGGSGDTMSASAGTDKFNYLAASDSPLLGSDTVINFDVLADQFVFDDAIFAPGTSLDFIGTGSFTNQAGQIRLETSGFSPSLQIDVDGNGTLDGTDMVIFLQNLQGTLSNSNFLLG